MAEITTFNCEYLVINSGYTSRLLQHELLRQLSAFCAELGVIPLYLRDSAWDNRILPFTIRNGVIVEGDVMCDENLDQYYAMRRRLSNNGLIDDGIIVFRVGNFQNATNVFTNIQQLDYCNWGNMIDMKFLRNNGQIDLAYIDFANS